MKRTVLAIPVVVSFLGASLACAKKETPPPPPVEVKVAPVVQKDVPVYIEVIGQTLFCAGLAGLVAASNIKCADANHAGLFLELDAILAVVVGGTALTGGRFYLAGALVGALFIQTLTTTMYMRNVSADVAPVPKAVAILAVCLLQSAPFRRKAASLLRGRIA